MYVGNPSQAISGVAALRGRASNDDSGLSSDAKLALALGVILGVILVVSLPVAAFSLYRYRNRQSSQQLPPKYHGHRYRHRRSPTSPTLAIDQHQTRSARGEGRNSRVATYGNKKGHNTPICAIGGNGRGGSIKVTRGSFNDTRGSNLSTTIRDLSTTTSDFSSMSSGSTRNHDRGEDGRDDRLGGKGGKGGYGGLGGGSGGRGKGGRGEAFAEAQVPINTLFMCCIFSRPEFLGRPCC
ncbi:hypothetical protein M426DRAFT_17844 [Hypoxylon sp. CI-4A]|nr:hypothetical protein M426DRAFT_17844 [Hypoxylon sp. CI-4A]